MPISKRSADTPGTKVGSNTPSSKGSADEKDMVQHAEGQGFGGYADAHDVVVISMQAPREEKGVGPCMPDGLGRVMSPAICRILLGKRPAAGARKANGACRIVSPAICGILLGVAQNSMPSNMSDNAGAHNA